MRKLEQDIYDLIEKAQPLERKNGKWVENYKPFIRQFAGRVRNDIKTKNPVHLQCLQIDITKILDIINPTLVDEIKWLQDVDNAVRLWVMDRVHTHRLLGIKNDNQ